MIALRGLKIASATRARVAATAGVGGSFLGYTSARLRSITGGASSGASDLKMYALIGGAIVLVVHLFQEGVIDLG